MGKKSVSEDGAGKPTADGAGKPTEITQLPDGSICINGACFKTEIRPNGEIVQDAADCSDELKARILDSVKSKRDIVWRNIEPVKK